MLPTGAHFGVPCVEGHNVGFVDSPDCPLRNEKAIKLPFVNITGYRTLCVRFRQYGRDFEVIGSGGVDGNHTQKLTDRAFQDFNRSSNWRVSMLAKVEKLSEMA